MANKSESEVVLLDGRRGSPNKAVETKLREEVMPLTPPTRTHIATRPSHSSLSVGASKFEDLIELLKEAKEAPIKAIDIETSTLRPYADGAVILTVAISFDDFNFSFALDHKAAGWSPQQRKQILDLLKELLINDTLKIAHNVPFEAEWFVHYFGPEVVNHEVWECTMLQAHFLDERRGREASGDDDNRRAVYQSLDFLCKMHFGIAYKSLFKLNKKDMGKSDLTETLIYNAVDTKYTLRLWHKQTELLKQNGLNDAYRAARARQPTLAIMQHLGVSVDQQAVKRLQGRLGNEIESLLAQINNLDVVKQYIQDHKTFNPVGNDAIVVFRDYLKRKEIHVKDGEKLRLSVDKHVLEKIDHPLAKLIIEFRNKTKMKSTYIDGLEIGTGGYVYSDGKLHTNFNSTFTVTARLSSDAPNLQNFPQRSDAWVRQQIVAQPSHYLVAFDYGQLEGCTGAMCSLDPALVKALWEDYDLHMEWAAKLAEKYPQRVGGDFNDPKVAKSFRSLIKNKLVFPAFFGAQNSSIAEYLGIPVEIVDDLMDEFWETFVGLKQWQDNLMKEYYKIGYVECPVGGRRHYPLTRNEAINAPIQRLASEIVVNAMCRLSIKAVKERKWHLHPRLNIHDDLSFEIPGDKLDESIETICGVMLSPPFGKIINVPLSVKVSVGRNWYQMSEVGQFWSHK